MPVSTMDVGARGGFFRKLLKCGSCGMLCASVIKLNLINGLHSFLNIPEEQIVMTPKSKTEKSTTIMIERRRVEMADTGNNGQVHVAGGNHTGIIINKQIANGKTVF